MNWILLIAFFLIFYGIILEIKQRQIQKKKYDPFNLNEVMRTKIICQECNHIEYRNWKKGDYILKEVECSKCKGKALITEIYIDHSISPQQERWERYCERWR